MIRYTLRVLALTALVAACGTISAPGPTYTVRIHNGAQRAVYAVQMPSCEAGGASANVLTAPLQPGSDAYLPFEEGCYRPSALAVDGTELLVLIGIPDGGWVDGGIRVGPVGPNYINLIEQVGGV